MPEPDAGQPVVATWWGSDPDDPRAGCLLLSTHAWQLFEQVARFRPQPVRRPRQVELLFDRDRGRVAILPRTPSSGLTTFTLVDTLDTRLPVRPEVWPKAIPCRPFLDEWAIAAAPVHDPALAHLENGMLVFTPGAGPVRVPR